MSDTDLLAELLNFVDVDPFALLGVSLSADEKRISKRYRNIAKQLHPDALANLEDPAGLTPEIASSIIARIVNPSYQKLKYENSRQETLTNLRLRVRRLVRTEKLVPTFSNAQQLADKPDEQVDVFYEQALTQLAFTQFRSLGDLQTHSLEIGQLNLVYLQRKMGDIVIRPKRTGLITNAVTPTHVNHPPAVAAPSQLSTAKPKSSEDTPPVDYTLQYVKRAKTYLGKQQFDLAVKELREAVKLSPQSPELHSMLGQAYFKQNLSGMAKAHFRQALKLKPTHKVAHKYGKLLGLFDEQPVDAKNEQKAEKKNSSSATSAKEDSASKSSSDKKTASDPEKPGSKRLWLGKLLNR